MIGQYQGKNWAVRAEKLGKKKKKNRAKALRKSCRIDRYEHGERSLLVFISTVMNMENGRCEMTFSRLLPDFFVAFIRLFRSFYLIFPWLLPEI